MFEKVTKAKTVFEKYLIKYFLEIKIRTNPKIVSVKAIAGR